jgi:hypothetical protein
MASKKSSQVPTRKVTSGYRPTETNTRGYSPSDPASPSAQPPKGGTGVTSMPTTPVKGNK